MTYNGESDTADVMNELEDLSMNRTFFISKECTSDEFCYSGTEDEDEERYR